MARVYNTILPDGRTDTVQIQSTQRLQQFEPSAPPELEVMGQNVPINDNPKWINDDEDELPPDYEEAESKKGMGCIRGCLASPHLKAWCATILVLFCLVCFGICLAASKWMCSCAFTCEKYEYDSICVNANIDTCVDQYGMHGSCKFPCFLNQIFDPLWGIVTVVAYGLYLLEVFCSSSFKYLMNIHQQETIYKYVERLHTYPPFIWWRVECYHYETSRDSDGNSSSTKVVTHKASANYIYNSWTDISAPLSGLDEWDLTKLKNYKILTFANRKTANDYKYKVNQFRRSNDLDTYQTFWSGVEIQDFKSKLLVEVQPEARSSIISLTCYVLSSIVLFTTCFRMHFAARCGRKRYIFNKRVSI